MGTNLMRALLLTSASVAMVATAAPTAAYAQEATYQIDIPAQSMGDALRALGKATKQNIVFNGSLVKGKRSAAVRGRMSAGEALGRMLQGSGLKMSRGSGGGLVVAQGGNAGAAPTSARQPVRSSQGQGRGAITGTVKDQISGAALKGALVELVGTGRTTSTDDLGEFRFTNVQAGDQTVRISYLGYVGQQSTLTVGAGETYAQDFTLVGGSGSQEIVVYGSRSARASSLNQERSAENASSVVSTDDLGSFSGTTISESLRRVPGVAFERDFATGDGTNIIIRGYAPDQNEVKLNGIALPVGNGTGRAPNLGGILADSVERITVNKTLLPNHDSSGTGGLVEIETKSPLDRPKRFLSAAGEFGRRGEGFYDDMLLSATASGKFGADNSFGVSASVQFRKQKNRTISYGINYLLGKYLPLDEEGLPTLTSTFSIDPRRPFPYEPGASQIYTTASDIASVYNENKNLSTTLSAEWAVSPATNLRLDWTRTDTRTERNSATGSAFSSSFHSLVPIASLGGEERRGAIWTGDVFLRQNYQITDLRNKLDVITLRGDSKLGRLSLQYSAGFAKASEVFPRQDRFSIANFNYSLDPSFVLPEAIDAEEGRILTIFGERTGNNVPIPLLNAQGFAFLNDPANFGMADAGTNASRGGSDRYNGDFKAKYEPGFGWLKYLEVGFAYERSNYHSFNDSSISYFGGPSLAALGLTFDAQNLSRIGQSDAYRTIPIDQVYSIVDRLPALASDPASGVFGFESAVSGLFRRATTRENQLNGYIQANLTFGKLEIVGGVRYDRTQVQATNPSIVTFLDAEGNFDQALYDRNFQLTRDQKTIETFLPRALINYRPADDIVLRAGYYTSVARPAIAQLSQSRIITLDLAPFYGPNGNQPRLEVSIGNPGLKSSLTHSFDISAELYNGNVGVVKLGAFYKRTVRPLAYNASLSFSNVDEGIRNRPIEAACRGLM